MAVIKRENIAIPVSGILSPHSEVIIRDQLETLRVGIEAGKASGPANLAQPIFDRLQAKYLIQASRQVTKIKGV
jgi:hypothetical protein